MNCSGHRYSGPLSLALISLIFLLFPLQAEAEIGELEHFEGTYVYAGGARELASRQKSVEVVVVELNALIRSLARRRLLEVVTPWPRIVFKCSGNSLSIERGNKVPSTIELNGAPVRFTNDDGDAVSVRRRVSKGALVEVIGDGTSSQTNTFRMSPDGKRLTMAGRVRSPQLPVDLRFTYTYRREG